jgi:hypothetical protein
MALKPLHLSMLFLVVLLAGAAQLAAPPVIDSVLNDAAWQTPPMSLGTWLSYNPMFGERLAQQTEVWVAYDRE